MDRRLILKRAHQNSTGSIGSDGEGKAVRKRAHVEASYNQNHRTHQVGDGAIVGSVFQKFADAHPGYKSYDVMEELAQRIEPIRRTIEDFENLDDNLLSGNEQFQDFEDTYEDDGFLYDDALMMWDDSDDLALPHSATANREEFASFVAGLNTGDKQELRDLFARSASENIPVDLLQSEMFSILSNSQQPSSDSIESVNFRRQFMTESQSNSLDCVTLQYLREAMIDDSERFAMSSTPDNTNPVVTLTSSKRSSRSKSGNALSVFTSDENISVPSSSSRRRLSAAALKENEKQEKASFVRGNYRCGRCGLPKVNHVCQFVDVVGTNVGTQVYAPIIDTLTGEPFDGERFITVSNRRSISRPVSIHVASGRESRVSSMDVDDSSTISFGRPSDLVHDQHSVGSPMWNNVDSSYSSRIDQSFSRSQLLMRSQATYVPEMAYPQQSDAPGVPMTENPIFCGTFIYPSSEPNRFAHEQVVSDNNNPNYTNEDSVYGNNTNGAGYSFVCTVNDQTDVGCFPFFCF